MSFASLGLSAPLLRAIEDQDYSEPTPVQSSAIPAILRGDDVWASAQTGSGKTAAFALPILQRLGTSPRVRGRFVRALVLSPTRELAAQLADSFLAYSRFLSEPIKTMAIFGGVSINPQMMDLGGGADVIVATPGRMLDLVERNAVSLSAVSTLVLDEADRLLDLGFTDEVNRVIALLPAKRQNLLFSATFPPGVQSLATALLRDPVRIEVPAEPETAPNIAQRAIEVDPPRRTQLLRHLIQENKWPRVLVFVATKYATEHVAEKLRKAGIDAVALHGELSQGARTRALTDFKASKIQVLLATDLAARGLDIEELPVVVNFDLPRSAADYTHRIGRTGRAGASGVAINFVSAGTHAHFQLIEKRHGLALQREQIPGFEPQEFAPPEPPPSTGGIKGKRKSKKDKLREAAGLPPGTPLSAAAREAALRANHRAKTEPATQSAKATEMFPLRPDQTRLRRSR